MFGTRSDPNALITPADDLPGTLLSAVDLLLSKAGRGAFGQGTYPKVMLLPSALHLASDAPPALATMKIPMPAAQLGIDPIEFDLMADVLGQ